jgi:hypothetical protein
LASSTTLPNSHAYEPAQEDDGQVAGPSHSEPQNLLTVKRRRQYGRTYALAVDEETHLPVYTGPITRRALADNSVIKITFPGQRDEEDEAQYFNRSHSDYVTEIRKEMDDQPRKLYKLRAVVSCRYVRALLVEDSSAGNEETIVHHSTQYTTTTPLDLENDLEDILRTFSVILKLIQIEALGGFCKPSCIVRCILLS